MPLELSRVPRRGAVPAGSKVFFSNFGSLLSQQSYRTTL